MYLGFSKAQKTTLKVSLKSRIQIPFSCGTKLSCSSNFYERKLKGGKIQEKVDWKLGIEKKLLRSKLFFTRQCFERSV